MKDVMIVTGVAQISLAIARRMGYGMKIIMGDFYKNLFAKCPAVRSATADEIANVAELLMSPQGAFITGSDY